MDLASEVEALRQRLDALTDNVTRHGDALTALEDGWSSTAANTLATVSAATDTTAEGGDSASEDTEPHGAEPDMAVLREWVRDNVSAWCERRVKTKPAGPGVRWCARWDLHPEAITRLWGLRALQLEAAQEGPGAVLIYLREHFDHHLAILTSEEGPFHRCIPKHVPFHDPDHHGYLPTGTAAVQTPPSTVLNLPTPTP